MYQTQPQLPKFYTIPQQISAMENFENLSDLDKVEIVSTTAYLADFKHRKVFRNFKRNSEITRIIKSGRTVNEVSNLQRIPLHVVKRAVREHDQNKIRIATEIKRITPTPRKKEDQRRIARKVYTRACPRCLTGAVELAYDPNVSAHTMRCFSCAWSITETSEVQSAAPKPRWNMNKGIWE